MMSAKKIGFFSSSLAASSAMNVGRCKRGMMQWTCTSADHVGWNYATYMLKVYADNVHGQITREDRFQRELLPIQHVPACCAGTGARARYSPAGRGARSTKARLAEDGIGRRVIGGRAARRESDTAVRGRGSNGNRRHGGGWLRELGCEQGVRRGDGHVRDGWGCMIGLSCLGNGGHPFGLGLAKVHGRRRRLWLRHEQRFR